MATKPPPAKRQRPSADRGFHSLLELGVHAGQRRAFKGEIVEVGTDIVEHRIEGLQEGNRAGEVELEHLADKVEGVLVLVPCCWIVLRLNQRNYETII